MDSIFRFGRAVGLVIGIISVTMYYVFAPVIMKTFIVDADTVRYGTQFLRARCFATPLLFLLNSLFGMTGIVWTQATADLFTVVVSYIIYARIRKHEGWSAGI
jgi:Na+-driven multidrug efflux pump